MTERLGSLTDDQKEQLSQLVVKYAESYQDMMEPITRLSLDLKKQVDEIMSTVAVQLANFVLQYRTAIQEGITNLQEPENYDPNVITIHPWTIGFVMRWGSNIKEDMEKSHFEYLTIRYEEGFEAYIEKDWQKAIFTFLSCLDSVLREYCKLHKDDDCPFDKKYPSHETTFNHLMNHYQYSVLSDKNQFHERLRAFFFHRHQIMHGDRYAFFDENIATISLLFLGLIFYAVLSDMEL